MKNLRKCLMLAAILALLLTLAGCTTVSSVENAIDEIGGVQGVTMNDRDAIAYAEQLYGQLSDRAKAKVENADDLAAARRAYDALEDLISQAEDAVAAIGSVGSDSGDAIARARAAYDAAENAGLGYYIHRLEDTLEDAEAAYYDAVVRDQLEEARNLLNQGRPEEAMQLAQEIISRHPNTEYAETAGEIVGEVLLDQAEETYRTQGAGEAMCLLETYAAEMGPYLDKEAYFTLWNRCYDELEANRPANGYEMHDTLPVGSGEFQVSASYDSDALVKMESVTDPEKYILFYVRRGDTVTINNVGDGEYIVKYTTGNLWYGEDLMFGPNASFTRAEELFEFATRTDSMYIYYTCISITLYGVIGGDLETTEIPADAF